MSSEILVNTKFCVGAVIKSQFFEKGYFEKSMVSVARVYDRSWDRIIERKGKLEKFDDPSRANAEFVIEQANIQTPRDPFNEHSGFIGDGVSGWGIKARRLRNDGTYDPEGQLIVFVLEGYYPDIIDYEKIEVVRYMEKVVTFI